jgi:aspartyl-tRNA synthetase
MKNLNYKLSQNGYFLNFKGEVEQITYRDYLQEYGSDETTTPRGIAPRLYVEGNSLMTWGFRGNNNKIFATFKNKREATENLFMQWESNVSESCDAPRFFTKKVDLFEDLADLHNKDLKVIKRYFKIQETIRGIYLAQQEEKTRIFNESKPLAKEDILFFISENKEMVNNSLKELNELKEKNDKDSWQIKANSLIQKVSKNDFRFLKWNEIYTIIRSL